MKTVIENKLDNLRGYQKRVSLIKSYGYVGVENEKNKWYHEPSNNTIILNDDGTYVKVVPNLKQEK